MRPRSDILRLMAAGFGYEVVAVQVRMKQRILLFAVFRLPVRIKNLARVLVVSDHLITVV